MIFTALGTIATWVLAGIAGIWIASRCRRLTREERTMIMLLGPVGLLGFLFMSSFLSSEERKNKS